MKNTKNTKKIISITLALAILVIIIYLINQYTELFWGLHSVPQSLNALCSGYSNFTCIGNPTINRGGEISFEFNKNLNGTLYNVALSCIGGYTKPNTTPHYVTNTSPPNSLAMFYALESNGTVESQNNINGTSINNNKTLYVKNLQCFLPNQTPISNLTAGSIFDGIVWISYTKTNSPQTNQSGSNPKNTIKILSILVKELN